jgi:hypothetical protein
MILVHGDATKPALPEMAGAPLTRVNNAGIASMRRGKSAAQAIGVGGNEDQVHVIWHQAPGPNLDVCVVAMPGQQIAVEGEVLVIEKRARAAIAALGDVVGDAGDDNTSKTGHAASSHQLRTESIKCTVTVIPQRAQRGG